MMKKLLAIALASAAVGANAQVLLLSNATYTQNFDGLGTGTYSANTFRDLGATSGITGLNGWYNGSASNAALNPSTGTSTTGSYYSFGSTAATDRSLGSITSTTTGRLYYVARLKNNEPNNLTSFSINYTMEQWRKAANAASQSLTFYYRVINSGTFSSGITSSNAGYTALTAMDAATPVFSSAAATALDGNLAANRVAKSTTLTQTLTPGQELVLMWRDESDTGDDHGLSIDDFSVTAVPEPTTMTAVAFGLAAIARKRKKA